MNSGAHNELAVLDDLMRELLLQSNTGFDKYVANVTYEKSW